MIATTQTPRAGLVSAAISDLRWRTDDGRSIVNHIDIVWCNYCDGFDSAESFLAKIVKELPGTPVGRLAMSMIVNNVRTELCR